MTYKRIQRTSSWQPAPQESTSRFARRPFTVEPQQAVNEAYQPNDSQQKNVEGTEKWTPLLDATMFTRPVPASEPPRLQMKLKIGQQHIADIQRKEEQTKQSKSQQKQPVQELNPTQIGSDHDKAIDSALENIPRSTSGLAASSLTNTFAKEAYDFWKDPANKDKPAKAIFHFLIHRVNEKLPYECGFMLKDLPAVGYFNSTYWQITIDPKKFSDRQNVLTVGDWNEQEVSAIVNIMYHEARHSEQLFRIMQMWAGKGKSIEEIIDLVDVPQEVLETAIKSPLKSDVEANKGLISEAEDWELFSTGKYNNYAAVIPYLLMDANNIPQLAKGYKKEEMDELINFCQPMEETIKEVLDPLEVDLVKGENKQQLSNYEIILLKTIQRIKFAFQELKNTITSEQNKPGSQLVNLNYRTRDLIRILDEASSISISSELDADRVGYSAGFAFQDIYNDNRKKK